MRKWIIFLALLAAFPPLSTDMYLPAIPTLVRTGDQPLWVVNLTLVAFLRKSHDLALCPHCWHCSRQ